MTIISVMAPPPHKVEGGGGMSCEIGNLCESAFVFTSMCIFSPTHWPLGQDPPKAFLFRVFLLNSLFQALAIDCLDRLFAPM